MKHKVFALFLLLYARLLLADEAMVIVTEPYPPFVMQNPHHPGVLWLETKRAIESQGYKVELLLMPWARALAGAKQGSYDAIFAAFWTRERSQWFYYSDPIGTVNIGFFKLQHRKDILFAGDINSLASFKVGVTRGSAVNDEFDRARYLDRLEYASIVQGLHLLFKGRVDVIAEPYSVVMYHLQDEPALRELHRHKEVEFLKPTLNTHDFYIAVSQKTPHARKKWAAINRGLRQSALAVP